MNVLHGLDGKSVVIGGALALGGLAAAAGGVLPLLLVGGLVYLVGAKQGWWGRAPHQAGAHQTGQRPPGVPPFFAEWHRQAHTAGAWSQPAAGQPAGFPPATAAPTPPAAAVAVPVVPAPSTVSDPAAPAADDRRPADEGVVPA